MEEKEILIDKSLEALGMIKDLDTLSIIYEAQRIKVKRKKRLINALGFITAFSVTTVNFIMFFTIGIKFFFISQLILSWLIVVSFLPVLKKKYI